MLWERLSGGLCAAGGCAAATAHRAVAAATFSAAQKVRSSPCASRSCPIRPILPMAPSATYAHSALADTSTRVAALADHIASTARVAGVISAAIAATADLSAACRGRFRQGSHMRKMLHVRVRVAACTAVALPEAATAVAARERLWSTAHKPTATRVAAERRAARASQR